MTATNSRSDRWRWRKSGGRVLLLAGLLLTAGTLQAQPAPPPPPAGPVVTVSRSWYVEAGIVAAMCGVALFVVCRSSRRN